jgi:hypothetical protein
MDGCKLYANKKGVVIFQLQLPDFQVAMSGRDPATS